MKAWITKYALTDGIKEVVGEPAKTSASMFCYTENGSHEQYAHGKGKDWHLTKEGAIARAEQMRAAKLRSIQKQFSRLEDMKF